MFVGGGDALVTGFNELELIRKYKPLQGASVIDIGCDRFPCLAQSVLCGLLKCYRRKLLEKALIANQRRKPDKQRPNTTCTRGQSRPC